MCKCNPDNPEEYCEQCKIDTKYTVPGRHGGTLTPWQPGQSGNPAGRPKKIKAAAELAEEALEDVMKTLKEIMLDTKAPHAARVSAAKELADRAMGKAKENVNISHRDDIDSLSEEELNAKLKEKLAQLDVDEQRRQEGDTPTH